MGDFYVVLLLCKEVHFSFLLVNFCEFLTLFDIDRVRIITLPYAQKMLFCRPVIRRKEKMRQWVGGLDMPDCQMTGLRPNHFSEQSDIFQNYL